MFSKMHPYPSQAALNKLAAWAFLLFRQTTRAEPMPSALTPTQEDEMAGSAGRRDTFFVRPNDGIKISDRQQSALRVETLTLPSGQRVHALERRVFDKAIKDAMPPRK
ncbi:hypothetical protein MKK52_12840 [Methylobacterium sp. J-067]|nr:hypothetical protein [Methylobacterium sp. J-067]